MTSLGKLVRTTAFKLSLAYLAVFAVSVFALLGYVAWNAGRVLDDQIVSTVEVEINGLAEQYKLGGMRRLVNIVERRSRVPGAGLYLVTTAAGERIAGNVQALPPGTLDRQGQSEIAYGRDGDDEVGPHQAIVRVFLLPGGFRLLVGRDVEDRVRLREIIWNASLLALGLVVVLGCLGGWFVARRVLSRVDAMTATTRTIMAGDLTGRLGVAGTGDELDRLAENLNAMLDRIGELMAGLREVSDNIAHDLKTPLTRLRGRADAALRGAASADELRAALESTIEESDNLIRVFNALLMIARLEAGNAREIMDTFDAAEVARGVADLYEVVAEEAGTVLRAEVEDGLAVHGNRELLGQALANLVDNAIKYGAAAPGEPGRAITLRATREDAGGQGPQVAIAVADHGPGIPEVERARVLERFVRLESARTRPGFGLGLSLVAAVARLHGGRVELGDNAPGLVVTLLLPLHGGGEGEAPRPAVTARPEPAPRVEPVPEKV